MHKLLLSTTDSKVKPALQAVYCETTDNTISFTTTQGFNLCHFDGKGKGVHCDVLEKLPEKFYLSPEEFKKIPKGKYHHGFGMSIKNKDRIVVMSTPKGKGESLLTELEYILVGSSAEYPEYPNYKKLMPTYEGYRRVNLDLNFLKDAIAQVKEFDSDSFRHIVIHIPEDIEKGPIAITSPREHISTTCLIAQLNT